MNRTGFENYLKSRQWDDDQIKEAIKIVAMYELFIQNIVQNRVPEMEDVWAFSRMLIAEKLNTPENYVALVRYGFFSKEAMLFLGMMEIVDGEESLRNLHQKLLDSFDEETRDYVFQDFGVPPLGTPTPEKPAYTAAVLQRMAERFDEPGCKDLLKDSLRDLPVAAYGDIKQQYDASADLDEFLQKRGDQFLDQMETLYKEGRPFFSQPVTMEVLDFLKQHPEITHGERDGNVVYEVKIPFLTDRMIHESDEQMKKYYYCHCPWARESQINPEVTVPAIFCNCSAGFHKKKWEVIFEQPVQAEVLESILMGDERCRFAIHLPL